MEQLSFPNNSLRRAGLQRQRTLYAFKTYFAVTFFFLSTNDFQPFIWKGNVFFSIFRHAYISVKYLRRIHVYLIKVVIKVDRILAAKDHIGRKKDVRPVEK